MSKTESIVEAFAVICENEDMFIVEHSLENAFKHAVLAELLGEITTGKVISEVFKDTPKHATRKYLKEKLVQAVYKFTSDTLLRCIDDETGMFSRIYHPKGQGGNGLLILKSKIDLTTGQVLNVQFYNSVNYVWGDPQKPTGKIDSLIDYALDGFCTRTRQERSGRTRRSRKRQ